MSKTQIPALATPAPPKPKPALAVAKPALATPAPPKPVDAPCWLCGQEGLYKEDFLDHVAACEKLQAKAAKKERREAGKDATPDYVRVSSNYGN